MGLEGGFRGGWSDVDDAWAMGMAWKWLDVREIAVTFGNNYAEPEMTSLRALMTAAGKKTPFDRGAVVKLIDPRSPSVRSRSSARENDAVRRMAALLRRASSSINQRFQ